MPVQYLYEVDINPPRWEPGLLVAEHQMRHEKAPVELGNWFVIQEAANWNPTNVTANVDRPDTQLEKLGLAFEQMAQPHRFAEASSSQ